MLRINVRRAVRNGAAPTAAMGIFAALAIFATLACRGEALPTPAAAATVATMSLSVEAPPSTINDYFLEAQLRRDGAAADIERLIAAFSEAIERDPNDAVAYMRRGTAYAAAWQGGGSQSRVEAKFHMALEDLTRAIELDDSLALAYFNRSVVHLMRSRNLNVDEGTEADTDYETAFALYDEAIKNGLHSVDAYLRRAEIQRYFASTSGDDSWRGRAFDDYAAALKLDPANSSVHRERAELHAVMGDYDKAFEALGAAIEVDPNDAHAYNARGNLYIDRDDYDSAIKEFDAVTEINPDFRWAYGNRGYVYNLIGEYDKAIEEFDAALAIRPYSRAYWGKAEAYEGKDDYKRAVDVYTESIAYWPGGLDTYVYRGNAHGALGEYAKAIQDYDAALAIRPDSNAYWDKAFAYISMEDYESAVQVYGEYMQHFPNDAEAYLNRGYAHYAKGDLVMAIRDYDVAIAIDELNASAYYHRGQAHAALGDAAKAREDLERALELGYHDPEAVERELKTLSGGE